jgi:hypothetical protein
VPDSPPIPAFLPLSLLEALRNLDTPVEDGLEAMARDIVSRRLGLSDTVAAQIERYRQATQREGTVTEDELAHGRWPRYRHGPWVGRSPGERPGAFPPNASGESSEERGRKPRFA